MSPTCGSSPANPPSAASALSARAARAVGATVGGAGSNTTVTLNRNIAIALALGGVFPLCRSPACVALRLYLGGSIMRQSATTNIDEASVGGVREETSKSALRSGPLLAAAP